MEGGGGRLLRRGQRHVAGGGPPPHRPGPPRVPHRIAGVTSTSISFDRIADRYDETRGGERRGQLLAAEIDPWLGPGSRILEIVVGTGIVATALARLGRGVVGVDISAEMLGRAHVRLGSRVARGDAHALPTPSGAVDAAYFVWVLHLVGDPAAAVAEAGRVLRSGGRLVVVAGRPWTEADDMTEHNEALDGLRKNRGDTAEATAEWAAGAGLRGIEHRQLEEVFQQKPAELADALEKRTFSFLWDLDEDTWTDVVQPAIDGLRCLPEPTRPRRVVHHRDLLVFEN
ncbi:MAG: methyltransferase domain-containing protein [Acidimicrobiia bacterium]|nr:methyltransferase domain-containing protein [Acidimicrobiia bacterium]